MKNLRGRVAVVTGASSGIGRATSVRLAEKGSHLALVDVNEEGLAETKRRVEAHGVRATTHLVDVSKRERMAKLPDEVLAAHGSVHVLVNNAGVAIVGDVETQRLEDVEWLFGINFWGVVHGCQLFLPHLKRAPEAHIVNISSVFGFIGLPTQSAYCASKFAVRGFTESLHAELHGTSVGVTCVHPGGINTDIIKNARMDDDRQRSKLVHVFATRTMSADDAGGQIVRAIEQRTKRLLVTREAYAIDVAKRLFPVLANEVAIRGRKLLGM